MSVPRRYAPTAKIADTTLQSYVKDMPESVYAMSDSMYEQIAGPPDEKQGLVMVPTVVGVQ